MIIENKDYGPNDLWEDNQLNYFIARDERGNEIDESELSVEQLKAQLERFLRSGRKTRVRKPRHAKNGDFTCKSLGDEIGLHRDTIFRIFQHEKGVIKRTFSGRNRKKYTILRIPKAVVERWRQEHAVK